MEKLNISRSVKHQFKMLGIDCINNARGVVYLQCSMRSVSMAISKILVLNPGVRVQSVNTATVNVVGQEDEKIAIVDACVIFEDINPNQEGEGFHLSFFLIQILALVLVKEKNRNNSAIYHTF